MIGPTASSQSKDNKLLGLEVIRFVTAVSVLVWHYQHFFYVGDQTVDFAPEQQPLYRVLSPLYQHGYCGVPIFWCISGFIFSWKYRNAIAQRSIGPGKFFVLRFSRLYPLHFATLLLVAALQAVYFTREGFYFVYPHNDLAHFIAQLFMAADWLPGNGVGRSFNGPIWSVSVEILVYLFFFVALRYIGKSAWVNVTVMSLGVIARAAGFAVPLFDCLTYFYAGGLAAMTLQHLQKGTYANHFAAGALALVVLVPLLIVLTHTYRQLFYRQELYSFAFLMAYVPVVLCVAAQNLAVPPFVQKAVEAAGNMTYSSYLLHFPIQLTITLYCLGTDQEIPRYNTVFFATYIVATLLASYYVYRYFEMPAQKRIRALLTRRPRLPARSAASAG